MPSNISQKVAPGPFLRDFTEAAQRSRLVVRDSHAELVRERSAERQANERLVTVVDGRAGIYRQRGHLLDRPESPRPCTPPHQLLIFGRSVDELGGSAETCKFRE